MKVASIALFVCRSSSSGSKRATEGRGPSGKGSGSGPKRAHTIPTPEQEREAALQVASHFMASKDAPSKDAPAHAVRMERKPVTPPPVLDEAAVQRKVTSIIDELVANADLKVRHQYSLLLCTMSCGLPIII